MSISNCYPGQRWISDTEPELGLGIACEVGNRRVVMAFPASDERRTYALDNAPLTRVKYRIADRIRSDDGREILVSARLEVDGCLVYQGLDALGEQAELHEIHLDSFVQFSRPLERLLAGQIDRASHFQLRSETLAHRHRHQVSPAFGLLGPRVRLLPHQFYIADSVAARHAPRVLLADEVGLGKTIEAGLILHRLMLGGRVDRAFILVPDNLVHQWLVEMLRRFNLQFSIVDDSIATELELSGHANPFESAQRVLAPLSLLTQQSDRLEQALDADWDMLIVDEAHHLAWTEEAASPEYRAVADLAAKVPGLLLLTATPEQLGVSGHFARLSLLDPHRYHDLPRYLEEEQSYAAVSKLVAALSEGERAPDADLLEKTTAYLGAERVAELGNADRSDFKPRLIRELLDHHGTGRVLYRNCRDRIAGFPQRRLTVHELPLPTVYRDLGATLAPIASLTPEREFDDEWLGFDPRAQWLVEWLKANRRDKTLVICTSADTAMALEACLRLRHGARSAVFHEGLDLVQRDRAAAYFADPEEDAEMLVCSEIGSEGRNFQFARNLILFDLPLSPDVLEQRIGRLDRIGQAHTVEIHVPILKDSASAVLASWLHRGINAFERTSPAGPALFAKFSDELSECMRNPNDNAAIEDLITRTATRSETVREMLKQGRDRLLELNSFDHERADMIVEAIRAATHGVELSDYMSRVFDAFGVDHEEHGPGSEIVRPGDHMGCEAFPGLPDGGLTICFEREKALLRDDIHFLTWEHPMVTGAMDLVLGSEFGNTGFGAIKSASLTPGTVLVECLFVIVCPAPPRLRIERFLSRSTLRVVLSSTGEDLSDRCTPEWMENAIRDVPVTIARKILEQIHSVIEKLADSATHRCERRQEAIVAEACDSMREEIDGEIERLRQLAKVNPNVRAKEISALEREREDCSRYLSNAQLKLDALRVAVTTRVGNAHGHNQDKAKASIR